MKNITTVILAAGKSSRFKHSKSKIFQEIAGLPIIDHVYKLAHKISNNDVIFVCNKDNVLDLKNKFKNAKFVIQKSQNGTAGAIICAKKYLNNKDVLILFGDVPLITFESIKKLIKSFYKNKSIGSMLAFNSKNPFSYGRVKTKGNYILSVVEELDATNSEKKINLCNSGIMLCNSKLLFSLINKISNKNLKNEKYLPDIFSIFNNVKKNFNFIIGYEDEMIGINTIDNLNKVENIYQKKIIKNMINNGVLLQKPESVYFSHDTLIGKGTVVEPFVVFKSGVIIKKNVFIKSHSVLEGCIINSLSIIGPSARIRPNSIIGKNVKVGNYVEIKNSIIGNKTSISHLSYIGDAKLGSGVNIGAGTITCNYDGKKKQKTIIEDNVFVGSNCSLVAPITIGEKSTIGAGSVITMNIPKNNLAVERSKVKIFRKKGKK